MIGNSPLFDNKKLELLSSEEVSALIKKARTEKGISLNHFAKVMNFSRQQVYNMESGKYTHSYDKLKKVVDYLQINIYK